MIGEVFEQRLGVLDPVTIDEVEETDAEPGIDDLRQMIDRATHGFGKPGQRQPGVQVYLAISHEILQRTLVSSQLFLGKTGLGVLDPVTDAAAVRHEGLLRFDRSFVVVDDQQRGVILQRNELRTPVHLAIATPAARRNHPVLKRNGIAIRQDVAEYLVVMPGLLEEGVEVRDQLIMGALCVFRHIAINAVGRKVIGDLLGIVMIPGVKIAFYKLSGLHERLPDLPCAADDNIAGQMAAPCHSLNIVATTKAIERTTW